MKSMAALGAKGSGATRVQRIEAQLRAGISAQTSGRLDEAQLHYRAVLESAPGLSDALHLLAQTHHLQDDNAEALVLVDRAIAVAPATAMYLGTRGIVLRALGRFDDAIAAFARALELDPRYGNAQKNLASLLAAHGNREQAHLAYAALVARTPKDAEAWRGLALVLLDMGRAGEAAAAAERAVLLDSSSASTLDLWFAAAQAAQALAKMATVLARLAAMEPLNFKAGLLLVDVRLKLDRFDDAEEFARRLTERWPDRSLAFQRLGVVLQTIGRLDQAAAAFAQALALDPGDDTAEIGLGNTWQRRGDPVAALEIYERIARRRPGCKEAWYNAGVVLGELDDEAEAIIRYDRAIALDETYHAARNNRAQSLLRLGRYAQAWSDYRWRDGARPGLPATRWPLELTRWRVHVHAEQGIGDHLFYLRFASLIVARGAELTVEAERRIEPMVRRAGLHAVDGKPETAIAARMGDLPWLLGMGDADVVAPLGLIVLEDRARRVAEMLGALPRPWLGVTWRAGGLMLGRDTTKEISLEALGGLLRGVGGSVVSVQRLPRGGEHRMLEAALGRAVLDLSSWNEDLEAMLALMAALDFYVCVSNANVHLRSGAGLGSDVLVPFPMDWRWRRTEAGEVPWYPSSRAYHQRRGGDWSDAFAALGSALAERVR